MHENAFNSVRGRVFDVQRFSIHDGPGIRARCPLVPGCNDRPAPLEGIARLASELPGLEAASSPWAQATHELAARMSPV